MSYESAPATRMIATDCACCGRPLLDSDSVELGIGPICRKRHGYFDAIDPDFRQEANRDPRGRLGTTTSGGQLPLAI